jgi:hypothetical protein
LEFESGAYVVMADSAAQTQNLATFRRFIERLPGSWQNFLSQRQFRLAQQARNGLAAEKVAENIVEDFLAIALDWSLGDLNNQLQYADIVLTHRGIRRLLIEVKRPGSLKWDQWSLESALAQARRYAAEQRVQSIAVSDGALFYAADLVSGGLQDRARLQLDAAEQCPGAWWLSVDGIYRPATTLAERASTDTGFSAPDQAIEEPLPAAEALLHPKHKVPAECFAYVGDPPKTASWTLPYRLADGSVDEKHLPGAIRAVLSNYRGTHVKRIPESAVGDVLVRLGRADAEIRKLPGQTPHALASYQQLYDALHQIQRLDELPM